MEGQTYCALCEYRFRSMESLKQHMESKHNIFNMTIVQVLTQQVERVNGLEYEMKRKEELIAKAEVDLIATKEEFNKEKEILQEKEKDLDDLIKSQKQKAVEEAKLIEELQLTKGLLISKQKELDAKTNELDAELKKVKVSEVSEVNEVSNGKQENSEANIKEIKKETPCKYFKRKTGCRRGDQCWFYHDSNHKAERKSEELKKTQTKKFKVEPKLENETMQERGPNLMQIIIELLRLMIRESSLK